MKRYKIQYYFLFILFIFYSSVFSQDPKTIDWKIYNSHEWTKYINPNSNEWQNLSSEERLKLFQIPEVELQQMTTKELVISCLNSRFSKLFFLYSNVNDYYNQLMRFNGFCELLEREDAAKTLLNIYCDLNTETGHILQDFRFKKKNILRWLELYLGHSVILNQLSTSEVKILLVELKKKYEIKKTNSAEYSIVGLATNIYAISRVVYSKTDEPSLKARLTNIAGISDLLYTANIHNDKLAGEIIDITNNLLNK